MKERRKKSACLLFTFILALVYFAYLAYMTFPAMRDGQSFVILFFHYETSVSAILMHGGMILITCFILLAAFITSSMVLALAACLTTIGAGVVLFSINSLWVLPIAVFSFIGAFCIHSINEEEAYFRYLKQLGDERRKKELMQKGMIADIDPMALSYQGDDMLGYDTSMYDPQNIEYDDYEDQMMPSPYPNDVYADDVMQYGYPVYDTSRQSVGYDMDNGYGYEMYDNYDSGYAMDDYAYGNDSLNTAYGYDPYGGR